MKDNLKIITLSTEDSCLKVLPELGGAILSYEYLGQHVFREIEKSSLLADPNVRMTACYPLIPFSNRIANAAFSWENMDYELHRNFGDSPHAIHGTGWQSSWDVASEAHQSSSDTTQRLTLTLLHTPKQKGNWPFQFYATQCFSLTPKGLLLTLTIQNLDNKTMPCGLGWHPFFQKTPETYCEFTASQMWLNDENMLPKAPVTLEEKTLHSLCQSLGKEETLDNCFSDFGGVFTLNQPELNRKIQLEVSKALDHIIIFTPPEKPFIAIEPVTHRNAAINSEDPIKYGLVALAKGQSLTAECKISLDTLSSFAHEKENNS